MRTPVFPLLNHHTDRICGLRTVYTLYRLRLSAGESCVCPRGTLVRNCAPKAVIVRTGIFGLNTTSTPLSPTQTISIPCALGYPCCMRLYLAIPPVSVSSGRSDPSERRHSPQRVALIALCHASFLEPAPGYAENRTRLPSDCLSFGYTLCRQSSDLKSGFCLRGLWPWCTQLPKTHHLPNNRLIYSPTSQAGIA